MQLNFYNIEIPLFPKNFRKSVDSSLSGERDQWYEMG